MFRKTLFAFLTLSLFFAACKKADNTPPVQFVINGVHDLNLDNAYFLDLSVSQTSGAQERVTITVTGLPPGITAEVDPVAGTPNFNAMISFSKSNNAVGGTYPIKIVGTSASFTKSYDLNLTVPPFNGIIVDGIPYSTMYMHHSGYTDGTAVIETSGGGSLYCTIPNPFPQGDGTYNYALDASGSSGNTMQLMLFSGSTSDYFVLKGAAGKSATVKMSGGKMTLTIPTVTLYADSGSGEHKDVSVSAKEY
jgi:hypothetical protein